MFSRNLAKTLLFSTALTMLTACAVVDKKDTAEESNWFVRLFEKDGQNYADRATIAYSNGQFNQTLEYTTEALKANPRNQQALLVGALAAEKLGRYNRARQYYEDLIIINGQETSILGSSDGQPQKISEIAKNNLRVITIAQSNLTIENRDGTKHFAIANDAGELQSKTTIANALNKKNITTVRTQPVGVDDIFTPQEQNIVSRFLILKELAEKDFITKDEFLSRRLANIGGLLPLTRKAPGIGIDQPAPSPDLIIERLEILKDGVENRAITPREFSVERDIIIEALMSPNPRQRIKNKAPSKNVLDAANDLRRIEVLYNLNLITENERNAEQKAVEKYLGINRTQDKPKVVVKTEPVTTVEAPAPIQIVSTPKEAPQSAAVESEAINNSTPAVTSPF
ncbi:MAG: tetratricopeptide repeat protein [Alphaproteobacteria bacterium]|nr:tetratricopeptide repeat protein [Alphaproteobacteria bacterium]